MKACFFFSFSSPTLLTQLAIFIFAVILLTSKFISFSQIWDFLVVFCYSKKISCNSRIIKAKSSSSSRKETRWNCKEKENCPSDKNCLTDNILNYSQNNEEVEVYFFSTEHI